MESCSDDFHVAYDDCSAEVDIPEADEVTPEELAQRLRRIGLSTDQNALLRMAKQLQKDGINNLEDLRGISKAEMKSEVAALKLDPVQFEKLFNAVSRL